mmetsp:Transcript_2741/g.6396  ORF Transcript_2741/g.6396 Transcript_2741/m.6396 type:complete len:294 (+) Transcript_2741:53-934(+)
MHTFKSAAVDTVRPFKDVEDPPDNECEESAACIGPFHLGWCVVEIHGPVQVIFMVVGVAALTFLTIEVYRGADTWRVIGGVIFVFVCAYLVWLGKAVYLIKAFRREIDKLKDLRQKLQGEVLKLEEQNREYESKNKAQDTTNQELSHKITDLSYVQKQLIVLSEECQGNVRQARQLLNRLERNLKLDTVNSVLLFFNRADQDTTGKVEGSNIPLFVDNLGFLWRHLPHFHPERVKAAIARKGGISLEQVHELVDSVMRDTDVEDPDVLSHRVETLVGGSPSVTAPVEEPLGPA